jgi:catalase
MSLAHAFQTGAWTPEPSIRGRRIAALTSDGVDDDVLATLTRTLTSRGANVQLVAPRPGSIRTAAGIELHVDRSLITTRAVEFDAVFVPNGEKSVRELRWDPRAWVFLTEACENRRAVLAVGHGVDLFDSGLDARLAVCADGLVVFAPDGVTLDATRDFISAIAAEVRARARLAPALSIATI